MKPRFAVILPMMGQLRDRFAVYNEECSLNRRLELLSRIEGVDGVEMVYPFEFQNVEEVKRLLEVHKLKCSTVNINLKSEPKFHRGSLTSCEPEIRAEAIRYLRQGMDVAAAMGCFMVTVCPLADGHDYPFEVNYGKAWHWLREGIAQAAEYRPDVKISIEYKRSETRAHCALGTAGIALLLCRQIGLPNIGVTLDIGHALYAGETPAQSVALLAEEKRLFLVHINDNYRDSDWDMIPGTVNLWDWLETLFYLKEVGYEGWFTSDVFPARLDPIKTLGTTINAVKMGLLILERMRPSELRRLIEKGDVLQTWAYLQDSLMGSN